MSNNLIINHNYTATTKVKVPWHFVPAAAVKVNDVLEYPVIAPLETRAKMKGGRPEDYIIEVETCVAYSRESQIIVAGCLSWMMEFNPKEFKQILDQAKQESDRLGENTFEET